MGVQPDDDDQLNNTVLAVIVDTEFEDGTDTVAAYSDGTSRFFSRAGGAILGTDTRKNVERASLDLISKAGKAVSLASPGDRHSPLEPGMTRFYLLTAGGTKVVEEETTKLRHDSGSPEIQALFKASMRLSDLKTEGYS